MMTIPFVDLKTQYQSIKPEIDAAIQTILDTTEFVQGRTVYRFEEEFAAAHQARHCVACSSGTDALHLILWALGIGQGDEVIVPANTFIATAEAVSLTGAKPVFADVDPHTLNMDAGLLERLITPRTRAIMPVHLYGQPADMAALLEITRRHDIHLVEDACQAHVAEYKGQRVGNFGVAAGFSFYPGKNLGAYGEGGGVITNDDGLAAKMRIIRDHGQEKKYYHSCVGHNYRMEGIQGAVLSVKLKYLDQWTEARRRNASLYHEKLSGIAQLVRPTELPDVRHVYHLYVVRVQHREQLMQFLNERGVATGLHYPVPLHLQVAYEDLAYKRGDFPVTEQAAAEILSLPMYPELQEDKLSYIAECISEFYSGHK